MPRPNLNPTKITSNAIMRLWSLCPRLLDGKGLGGCWVEALLCQSALAGRTTAYRNHPQVARWRETPSPLAALGAYLAALQQEATRRGFNYNASLILEPPQPLAPAPPALEVCASRVSMDVDSRGDQSTGYLAIQSYTR